MPRQPRKLPDAAMLHLICRGNNGTRIFKKYSDFLRYKKTLIRYLKRNKIYTHHYTFMNTHIHLLAWSDDTTLLADAIKAINLSYHYYYKEKYKYKGHLWHSRYRSIIIKDESQWMQCARYIELNPVYARLCPSPQGYRWTSYHYYAMGKKDALIMPKFRTEDTSHCALGKINKQYADFVNDGVDLDYQKLKKQFESESFSRSSYDKISADG